ncbi:hypothetical protein BGZ70_007831 [Mortierella alpina]|uniref:F-box/LRR-repeat protein 15/At3g58940/PEG3-like LRR domain-containing protein n=1 Tax=Mortierella alpina TaxID=64518 RepID=A0A9P6J762_MORAP|nr:hypothetical protein BGZ70_007831 [Mortierella alpina]
MNSCHPHQPHHPCNAHRAHPTDQTLIGPPKQHALHIPEIVSLIAAWLSRKEILYCRGVCHDWRRIFSPFLHRHPFFWNHGQERKDPHRARKASFGEHLLTLGPYVEVLRLVYPIRSDLELIARTCTVLRHIELYTRNKQMLHTRALTGFLGRMTTLEEVTVHSYASPLVASVLQCLATCKPSGRLRKLTLTHATHSVRFPTVQWKQVVAALANHPQVQSLSIQECSLLLEEPLGTWEGSDPIWPIVQIHNALNAAADALSTTWRAFAQAPPSSNPMLEQDIYSPTFSHLENIHLQNVRISEELLCSILSQCPALTSLEFKPTGCNISVEMWSRWLPHCTRMKSIKVESDAGGMSMDILRIWTIAPQSLDTFHISSNGNSRICFSSSLDQPYQQHGLHGLHGLHGQQPFTSPLSRLSIIDDSSPGSTLVSLHLDIGLRIEDRALHYMMAACRLLRNLVIGIQYFNGLEPASYSESSGTGSFPHWACALSLRRLEIRTTYLRQDQQLDLRLHAFMRRLEDLTALEHLLLPMKMLNDLSESRSEEYAAFRGVLDYLDHLQRLREREERMRAISLLSSAVGPLENDAPAAAAPPNLLNEQQRRLLESQGQVWARDGSAPLNFIPQLPLVREVTLKSAGSSRLMMKMWYLHIVMEAMPRLRLVWTAPDLYGIDLPYNFKQVSSLFQRHYGATGVKLSVAHTI